MNTLTIPLDDKFEQAIKDAREAIRQFDLVEDYVDSGQAEYMDLEEQEKLVAEAMKAKVEALAILALNLLAAIKITI